MKELRTSYLPEISYSKLVAADESEAQKLREACSTHGFFYLDLVGVAGQEILETRGKILQFMYGYFDQHIDVKMQDDRHSDVYGYEPVRTSAGATPHSRDFYESLKLSPFLSFNMPNDKCQHPLQISRTQIQSQCSSIVKPVRERLELFREFLSMCDDITILVLTTLSRSLRLTSEDSFETVHRASAPSGTNCSMFRYPVQTSADEGIGHNKHTDLGTLTLLFSEQRGLQVISPETNQWEFVAPKDHCAIMNVGDALRFLSKNRFRSAVHRVLPLNGQQQLEHRYSIAYFLRPEDDVEYVASDGRLTSAKSWHDLKFAEFRSSSDDSMNRPILTGGMEQANMLIA